MESRFFKIPEQINELNEWCKNCHTWEEKIETKDGIVIHMNRNLNGISPFGVPDVR